MATKKPEIQYVGQFYVYGSEAQAVAVKKRPQFQLPKPKLEIQKIEKIYVDPVALIGLAVAVVMLVCMVVGACQIHSSWQEYKQMSHYLSQLQQENARLEHNYHISYDMAEVEAKAIDKLDLILKAVDRTSIHKSCVIDIFHFRSVTDSLGHCIIR